MFQPMQEMACLSEIVLSDSSVDQINGRGGKLLGEFGIVRVP